MIERDNTQGKQNGDFNFTKEIATLHHQNTDNTQGVQNRDFNFAKEISTSHSKKRDNTQEKINAFLKNFNFAMEK